ncbi:MAG: TIGR03809 family protein [Rhodoplanes sp.]
MFSVDLARKWRALAQRRKAHLVDLYHSGRWRLYYSEADFAERLRAAVCLVDRWTATVQAAAAEAVRHGRGSRPVRLRRMGGHRSHPARAARAARRTRRPARTRSHRRRCRHERAKRR